MTAPYHQAGYFALAIHPRTLREFSDISIDDIDLRIGRGWSYRVTWRRLRLADYQDGTVGAKNLQAFAAAVIDRPSFWFFDTTGLRDQNRPAVSAAATRPMRGGLMRVREVRYAETEPVSDPSAGGEATPSADVTLTMETWQEAPAA